MKKLQRENDLTCIFIAHSLSVIAHGLSVVKYISDRIGGRPE